MSKDEKSLQKTQQPIQGLTSDEAARLLKKMATMSLQVKRKKVYSLCF